MIKKCSIILLSSFLFTSLLIAHPRAKSSPQATNRTGVNLTPQLELFFGGGFFTPSFQKWDDAIKEYDTELTTFEEGDPYQVMRVSTGTSILEGNYISNLGVKYYFTPDLSLSLSVSRFKSDVSNDYAYAYGYGQGAWPYFFYEETGSIKVSQSVEIYPTLLTLYYNLPFSPLKDHMKFYVGGGLGFYFSQLKSEISQGITNEILRGSAPWDTLVFSQNPIEVELLGNIRANANPLGYHVSAGFNYRFGILNLNAEVGYNFVTANFDDKDWKFFSRQYTPISKIEGKDLVDGEYETRYSEDQKFYYGMEKTAFDKFKVDKLSLSGLVLRAGFGLSF